MATMANVPDALHTYKPSPEEVWLDRWTQQAPVLEPDKADEILELMGLL